MQSAGHHIKYSAANHAHSFVNRCTLIVNRLCPFWIIMYQIIFDISTFLLLTQCKGYTDTGISTSTYLRYSDMKFKNGYYTTHVTKTLQRCMSLCSEVTCTAVQLTYTTGGYNCQLFSMVSCTRNVFEMETHAGYFLYINEVSKFHLFRYMIAESMRLSKRHCMRKPGSDKMLWWWF